MAEKSAVTRELELDSGVTDEGLESLGNLERKILQTVAQLKSLRAENAELREASSDLHRRVADQDTQLKDLRGRLARMESERDTVKSRVQRLIAEVDSLSPEVVD